MKAFNYELYKALKDTIKWSTRFTKGNKDLNFDIDNVLYSLEENYNVDFKTGSLLLIYTLLDFYCDAVKHNFIEIATGYKINEALNDIKSIALQLEKSDYQSLVIPKAMKYKIEKSFF